MFDKWKAMKVCGGYVLMTPEEYLKWKKQK